MDARLAGMTIVGGRGLLTTDVIQGECGPG